MTGIIILAGGVSSRLGTPKQNLIHKGKTLLQRAIETAMASICEPIIVVLGANAAVIKPSINHYKINIAQNAEWDEGMASSIRTGINELQRISSKAQSVILMLCDQPLVDTHIINLLIMAKPKAGISVCSFSNTVGPPVLFDSVYFEDLLSLKGAEGAKNIIQKYYDKVAEIPFPDGHIDIDTVEDYATLNII